MAELREVALRLVPAEPLGRYLGSPTLNLEVDRYPHYEFDPDPARGPHALTPRPWGGEYRPLFPPTPDKLNGELNLLKMLWEWRAATSESGAKVPARLGILLTQAVALNRAIWRDATLADFSRADDIFTVGEYIRMLRRKRRDVTVARWGVGWAESSETHYGSRLPRGDETWVLLLGGQLQHVVQSEGVVIELGHCRFQSWAPCTNDSAHGPPCTCRYCMHSVDPDFIRDPDLEHRIREDPVIGVGAEISTSSGWGPSGPLRSLRAAYPDLSAYGIRLVALFGRPQFDQSLQAFERWYGLRRSGKKVGRPKSKFDAVTENWIGQRLADGRSSREVYAEYLTRPNVEKVSFATFRRRHLGSQPPSGSKPPVSANPD